MAAFFRIVRELTTPIPYIFVKAYSILFVLDFVDY
jgi:hypothetical protein